MKLNKCVKIIVFSYFIFSLFIISMSNFKDIWVIREDNTNSMLDTLESGNSINVTKPQISFDNMTMILNITDVFASISGIYFNGSANASAEISNFSIYFDKDDGFTGITGILNDTDYDGNWNATVNLSVYSLTPGIYYVKCYFENNSGLDNGTSPESDRFAILGKYNITNAVISYSSLKQQLNITDITIRNSTDILNNSGVSQAKWSIFYNNTGSNTSYCGNLNYDNNTKKWNATNIDVSNLTEGIYFIISSFIINSQISISNLDRSILQTFTIIHKITITSTYYNYTGGMTQELKLGLAANTSFQGGANGRPLISNEANVSYTIMYRTNGSSTGLSGNLVWVQNSWNITVDVSGLSEGEYNISFIISHVSNNYSASDSYNTSSFEIIHSIQINIPQPIFNRGPATLDIIGITVVCSYSNLGYLNASEVDIHKFMIYNSTGNFTGIWGNLTYDDQEGSWNNTGISLENFTEGFYYIYVFFNNSIVPEGSQENSSNFEVIHKINFQPFQINYIGEFKQILNITGVSATSSYYPFSKLQGYTAFRTHNYSFYNRTSRNPANPPLTGQLEWNGSYWNAYNINVSQLPIGEYYVVLNFADNISINSYGRAENNNFTIIHVINVSVPIINYVNNFSQLLNITNITCRTSYSPQAYLNSTTANNYQYYIFNDTYQISGQLVWNDPYWEAINVDVSSLKPGNYRVRCFFSSSEAGSIYSDNSTYFQISHVFNITTPSISFDSTNNKLDILGIQVYASNKQFVTNLTAITHIYQIFNQNNLSILIGNLTWNITSQRWEAHDIDVSSLVPGKYYVKVNFSVYQITGTLTSDSSQLFEVPTPESSPPDYSWVFIIVILALIIPFLIGFLRRLIVKKEDSK
ncbi:MAG: hypothetical protein ACTSPY_05595 [Candidatus Helarchaeota archaeon]